MAGNLEITQFLLLNVPLESDYKNTLYFESKSKQTEYFKSRMVRTYNLSSYQKKDEPIRVATVDANGLVSRYDDLINAGVNYVMYQNSAYTTRWFYAFIKKMEYIDEGRVDIYIETDCMQTWMFDYFVKPSFVEREHVSDDAIGKHTVPENLETGEYICGRTEDIDMGEPYIVIGTTQIGTEKVTGSLYGGIYSGVKYLAYKLMNYNLVNNFLKELANEGAADAVTGIFIVPYFVIQNFLDEDDNIIDGNNSRAQTVVNFQKHNGLGHGDYYPVNNKLYTYPYCYLLASNNTGNSAIYKFEDFEDATCQFNLYGVVCPGASIKLVPKNYKGASDNLEESLNAGKFPICNWNTDVYTNWLTQNSVNIGLSVAQGGLQMLGGVGMMFTGVGALAGAGSIASGGMSIAQTLGQVYQQSMVPPQAEGNLNCGDVLAGMDKNTISFYAMTLKSEYAKIIDQYFHMFGYKVNLIKKPNKAHRSNFWYTKTIDVNIDGNIPNDDMQIIKNAYNNGITFWRNAEEIQDYSWTNNISITDGAVTDEQENWK